MQTIQFKVDDNNANIVLTLLKNLKKDMVQELRVTRDNKSTKNIPEYDEQMILDRVKGILKNRISNPIEYQRALRDEWERVQE